MSQCINCGRSAELCVECAMMELPEEQALKQETDPYILSLHEEITTQGGIIMALLEHMQVMIDTVPQWDSWHRYEADAYECVYCEAGSSLGAENVLHDDDCPLVVARRLLKEHASFIAPEYEGPISEDLS